MSTEFIEKHKGKVGGTASGLSVAAVVWMYATFPSASEFTAYRNERAQSEARQWQKIAELELDVERCKMRLEPR